MKVEVRVAGEDEKTRRKTSRDAMVSRGDSASLLAVAEKGLSTHQGRSSAGLEYLWPGPSQAMEMVG